MIDGHWFASSIKPVQVYMILGGELLESGLKYDLKIKAYDCGVVVEALARGSMVSLKVFKAGIPISDKLLNLSVPSVKWRL